MWVLLTPLHDDPDGRGTHVRLLGGGEILRPLGADAEVLPGRRQVDRATNAGFDCRPEVEGFRLLVRVVNLGKVNPLVGLVGPRLARERRTEVAGDPDGRAIHRTRELAAHDHSREGTFGDGVGALGLVAFADTPLVVAAVGSHREVIAERELVAGHHSRDLVAAGVAVPVLVVPDALGILELHGRRLAQRAGRRGNEQAVVAGLIHADDGHDGREVVPLRHISPIRDGIRVLGADVADDVLDAERQDEPRVRTDFARTERFLPGFDGCRFRLGFTLGSCLRRPRNRLDVHVERLHDRSGPCRRRSDGLRLHRSGTPMEIRDGAGAVAAVEPGDDLALLAEEVVRPLGLDDPLVADLDDVQVDAGIRLERTNGLPGRRLAVAGEEGRDVDVVLTRLIGRFARALRLELVGKRGLGLRLDRRDGEQARENDEQNVALHDGSSDPS